MEIQVDEASTITFDRNGCETVELVSIGGPWP